MVNTTKNKYVDFISDQHFMKCVGDLFKAYENTKNEYTEKQFYKNKIDPIKLTFDMKFNNLTEKEMIAAEIQRQADKNISNFIGHFHEELMGGITEFEHIKNAGYDLRKVDNTIFAEIKNKQNTVNSSSKETTYQKLQRFAETNTDAKCYWVSLIAGNSYCEQWNQKFEDRTYNHPRVYKVSGDRFYEIVTGDKHAFMKLCTAIPHAIDEYLEKYTSTLKPNNTKVYSDIYSKATKNGVSVTNQLFNDNFNKYNGFPIK
ncbi:Eco47II family restriction endonuclease [Fictibacillus phosphorivorans]|uniref:Eco47II family restriction endonuclease n=1 Tax=Fictibacillus phosphorivorans TaxID=1221500 RepID=UPI0035EE0D0B